MPRIAEPRAQADWRPRPLGRESFGILESFRQRFESPLNGAYVCVRCGRIGLPPAFAAIEDALISFRRGEARIVGAILRLEPVIDARLLLAGKVRQATKHRKRKVLRLDEVVDALEPHSPQPRMNEIESNADVVCVYRMMS